MQRARIDGDDPAEHMDAQADKYLGIVKTPPAPSGSSDNDDSGRIHFPVEPDPGNEFARRKKRDNVAVRRPTTRLRNL